MMMSSKELLTYKRRQQNTKVSLNNMANMLRL